MKAVRVRAALPQWFPYELRRLGKAGLAAPALAAGAFVALAVLMSLLGGEERTISRVLTAGLELGLSLVAGLVAVHVVASEPAADLQLTLKTRYRTTLVRRLALLVGWTALAALLWATALRVLGLWAVPGPFLLGQLAWIAPLLWFVSLGVLLALAVRSRTAAGAVLGGIWVFENTLGVALFLQNDWLRPFFLFATTHTPGAGYWFWNRVVVTAVALALFGVSLALLRREAVATGGEE